MIDDLIIITKHYPFKPLSTPGESYLGNEVPVLCKYVKRVHVFCTEVSEKEKTQVELPENLMAYAVCKTNTNADKIECGLKGFGYFLNAPDYLKKDREHKPFRAKTYLHYFCRRGEQKYKRIKESLEGIELGRNVMIYSYWCYDHAYAAVRLKDWLSSDHTVHCLTRAHRYDLYEYNHVFSNSVEYIPLREWLFANLDAVCPCSKDGTDYLAERYPAFSNKFITSYIGTKDHKQSALVARSTINLCSCSQIIEVKRVDRLIQCISLLCQMGYSISWTHFGGGKLYNDLLEKAKTVLSKSKCKWSMPGKVNNSDIMRYYESTYVDLFVNVSENEGLPISIMEASSFGIPTIATDVGGTSEIVEDGKTGFLIQKDFSDKDFLDVFEKWVKQSESQKNEMREAARKKWLDNFEYQHNAEKMISLMEGFFEH